MTFNPNEHITKLKGKDYLEVKWRMVWFRDKYPQGIIKTSLVHLDMDKNVAVFKAEITDGEGGHAEGHGSESAKDFGDYIEKAETKAVGRALAALGYGTQFAPELDEGERIADSPVDRSKNNQQVSRQASTDNSNSANSVQITAQQLSSIRKLCEYLGKSEPENVANMNYVDAKQKIQDLTAEYRRVKAQPVEQPSAPIVASTPSKSDATSAQPKAVLDMIAKAKARVEAIGMIWDDVKRDALGENVADNALTVQQTARINGTVTTYERTAKQAS